MPKLLTTLDASGVGRAVNFPDPQLPQELATKAYVDAISLGLKVKDPVRVKSSANVNVASAPATIDAVSLASGDRVLLNQQSAPVQNGVYVFASAGQPLTRASDFAVGVEVRASFFFVMEGSVFEDTGWVCTNNEGADVVGTDALTFAQFSGPVAVSPGAALAKTGNVLDVQVDGSTVVVNISNQLSVAPGVSFGDHKVVATIGDGVATSFLINHALNTQSVLVSIREVASNEHVLALVEPLSTTQVRLTFSSPPPSNSYAVTILG